MHGIRLVEVGLKMVCMLPSADLSQLSRRLMAVRTSGEFSWGVETPCETSPAVAGLHGFRQV